MSDDPELDPTQVFKLANLDQAKAAAMDELRELVALASAAKTLLQMEGFSEAKAEDIAGEMLMETFSTGLAAAGEDSD